MGLSYVLSSAVALSGRAVGGSARGSILNGRLGMAATLGRTVAIRASPAAARLCLEGISIARWEAL